MTIPELVMLAESVFEKQKLERHLQADTLRLAFHADKESYSKAFDLKPDKPEKPAGPLELMKAFGGKVAMR